MLLGFGECEDDGLAQTPFWAQGSRRTGQG